MVSNNYSTARGFSLVELLVVAAVMLVVFGGIIISFRYSLELISHSRAKLTALTLANDQMEYLRSLSYNAVGTVSGIPAGLMPQVSTTSLNGIMFTKRLLIEYIDDDADGIGASDSNGITTDYKQAKVTIEWTIRGLTKNVFLVTNIIPRSIETDVGGGTMRVNVYDSANAPLPGASVRLFNTTLAPTIDVTRTSDATGAALFGGAPAGSDYQIVVTAAGYSTDQTYQATTTLPNPNKLPISVLEAAISTSNFFIDRLSDVSFTILSSKITGNRVEDFSSIAGIATSTNTVVSGGAMILTGAPSSYSASGTAYLTAFSPSPLAAWDYLQLMGTISANTAIEVRLYTGTSTPYTLIPDSVLPNNSAGFSLGTINLSNLDSSVYPTVRAGITLRTTNSAVTPRLDELVLGYVESKVPLSGQTLQFVGNKQIGSLADTSPVFKTVFSTTTSATGTRTLRQIEYDFYTLSVPGYDIASLCPAAGLDVKAGTTANVEVVASPNSAHTLRVLVQTASGVPITNASVTIVRGAFSQILKTGRCGQVFFAGLTTAPDYMLDVSASGYPSQTVPTLDVTGDIRTVISL